MNIKERLTQEIKAAKRRVSTVDILFELQLSKTRRDHFQKKIDDLQDEMKKYPISKNWIGDGCNDIMREVYPYKSWIEGVTRLNLNNRPEDEFWHEVQWFLQKYFLILEYKKYIPNKKQPKKTELNPDLKLADVLMEGVEVDKIKMLYNNPKNNREYIGRFLLVLVKLEFIRTISLKELEIIARNEFLSIYKHSRNYNPPKNIKNSCFKSLTFLKKK
jgi:hypothetical protein